MTGRRFDAPFLLSCLAFVVLKAYYLLVALRLELYGQDHEELARLWHAWMGLGMNPLQGVDTWLPLHSIVLSGVLWSSDSPLVAACAWQSFISVAGGLLAAMLARDLCDGDWRAGALTLCAWAGSGFMLVLGVGFLSEPLFHLELMFGLWAFHRWARSGRGIYLVATLFAVVTMNTTRYEGWVVSFSLLGLGACANVSQRIVSEFPGLSWKRWRAFALLALATVLPVAVWLYLNESNQGDPLAFLRRTRVNFDARGAMTVQGRQMLFLALVRTLAYYQPLVVVGGLTAVVFRRGRTPMSLTILALFVALTALNYWTALSKVTAIDFIERLSTHTYALLCPLYAVACVEGIAWGRRRWPRLQRLAALCLLWLCLAPLLMGLYRYDQRKPAIRYSMGKDVVDACVEQLGRLPSHPRPRVLFDITRVDYSQTLFAIAFDQDDWEFYDISRQQTLEGQLAAMPSIRIIVLNSDPDKLQWAHARGDLRLLKAGPVWNAYVIESP